MKYDTVIGTIGNTHGVSSDSAPIAAASHRYAPNVLARDDAARSGTGARGLPTSLRELVPVDRRAGFRNERLTAAFSPGAIVP